MSKRIPTDQGGRRGPQSSNRDNDRERGDRDRDRRNRHDRYKDDRDDQRDGGRPGSSSNMNMDTNFTGMPFSMPGFPSLPNGMPMMPPGFSFPGFAMQNQGSNQYPGHDGSKQDE